MKNSKKDLSAGSIFGAVLLALIVFSIGKAILEDLTAKDPAIERIDIYAERLKELRNKK
jgi:hypothetical protein